MSSSLDPKDLMDIPDPFAEHPHAGPARPPLADINAFPPAPTRSRTTAMRVAAVVAALGCDAVLVSMMGIRSGHGIGATVLLGGVVLPGLAAGTTLAVVQGSASRKPRIVVVLIASLIAFVLTTLLTSAAGDDSVAGMIRCVIGTSMMIAGPAMLAIASMRRAFVSGAGWRTAALGLGSGLIGATATRLYCPNDAVAHVLVSHGLPVLLAAGMAVVLGTRFTRA